MLGARNISHTPKGVTFMFSGSRKFNGAKIDLNGSDTYDLTLGKYSVKSVIEADPRGPVLRQPGRDLRGRDRTQG